MNWATKSIASRAIRRGQPCFPLPLPFPQDEHIGRPRIFANRCVFKKCANKSCIARDCETVTECVSGRGASGDQLATLILRGGAGEQRDHCRNMQESAAYCTFHRGYLIDCLMKELPLHRYGCADCRSTEQRREAGITPITGLSEAILGWRKNPCR